MSEEKRVVRMFFAWEDDREERWLEQMAAAGWHLVKGGIVFRFRRGEPAAVRYRLDYRERFKLDRDEYYGLFRDAGWEPVGDFFNWHYFRSPAAAQAPEIYSDTASRVDKYRRLLWLMLMVAVMNVPNAVNLLLLLPLSGKPWRWLGLLNLAAAMLVGYGALRLALTIRRLKRQDPQRA